LGGKHVPTETRHRKRSIDEGGEPACNTTAMRRWSITSIKGVDLGVSTITERVKTLATKKNEELISRRRPSEWGKLRRQMVKINL